MNRLGCFFGLSAAAAIIAEVGAVNFVDSPSWAQPNQTAPLATCRCFPGDDCWPSDSTWDAFNNSIGGRLIATVPLAAPCHDDAFAAYSSDECSALQAAWFSAELHIKSPSSIMASSFTNNSCNPFLPKTSPCIVGSYVSYSVNVSEPMDVVRTIWFATYFNIRLVVKNTGHDYNGKSTGAGAIGLWTQNLKNISVIDYQSVNYTGKAIKVDAGVLADEAFAAASAQGLVVVGPEISSVGYAGGFTQGGGHSTLSSLYGLAADQVIEWEVVDGRGNFLKASPSVNADLYWALCGGGGGTFGVVTSMISKAYPDMNVTGAIVTFTNAGVTQDQYYNVLETFQASLSDIVDSGALTISFFTNETFELYPLTAPGQSPEQVNLLLSPLTSHLRAYNMSYTYNVTQFPGYYQQFSAQSASTEVGVGLLGGRLIPRSVVDGSNKELLATYRDINEQGGTIACIGLNVNQTVAGNVWNAVNPGWRETLISTVIQMLILPCSKANMWTTSRADNSTRTTRTYNETDSTAKITEEQDKITYNLLPRLDQLTPGVSAYLNEGDFQEPEWQQVFYGGNYGTLKSIKDRYDPFHQFYAKTAVGSEFWVPQEDGRLCKA